MKEMEEKKKKSGKKENKRPSDKKADKSDKSDNYSSDSDKGDVRFMDINDLKRNQSSEKKRIGDSEDEEAYDEDEFN